MLYTYYLNAQLKKWCWIQHHRNDTIEIPDGAWTEFESSHEMVQGYTEVTPQDAGFKIKSPEDGRS